MLTMPTSAGSFEKAIVRGFGPERTALEGRLQRDGIPLAITERSDMVRDLGHTDATLVVVAAPGGVALNAANIAATRSRALIGHRRLRVTRFGASESPAADEQLLGWIAEHGREDFRCLALNIELFDRDAAQRARLAAVLASLGFTRSAHPRSYQTTLALDLSPSADELLGNLHRDTRRDVRAPLKHNMQLRPVDDPSFASRIEHMVGQTFARTGGIAPRLPWAAIIGVSSREPSLSRISGVFDASRSGPESLVSFAWGINRGSYTTYEAGASIRRKDLRSLPLGYAPVWDLVVWAKQTASGWFDFGGVTKGDRATPNNPVGGISAFKRSFCNNVVEVGEEWALRPHPVRGAVADLLATATRLAMRKHRGSL
jgi:hypothetical protein